MSQKGCVYVCEQERFGLHEVFKTSAGRSVKETVFKGRLTSCSYNLQPFTDLISWLPSAIP
jgi:hypothetical protein